jgi:hypothetical protein
VLIRKGFFRRFSAMRGRASWWRWGRA